MIERQIDISTSTGRMGTFVCHPERDGPHPVLILFMDAPGIREELRDMARRLETVGYYVLLPNLYYREGVEELGDFRADESSLARMRALMEGLTIPMVMEDADALLTFAGTDSAASKGPIGSLGYYRSGRYALSLASRHPDRVVAAASIYGTQIVTDRPDSVYLTLGSAKARLYIACAEHDDYVPLEAIPLLEQALSEGGVDAGVELYPEVRHGFAFPERSSYDNRPPNDIGSDSARSMTKPSKGSEGAQPIARASSVSRAFHPRQS